MKKFNTTGLCFPSEHYMLPALDRLPGVRELVAGVDYFVVHPSRQTGKTTALKALVKEINEKDEMYAFYCTYAQCAKYLDLQGLSEGWMPIFEKSKEKSWDENIYSRDEAFDGKTIHVL